MIEKHEYQQRLDELRIQSPDFAGLDKLVDGWDVINAIVLKWALAGELGVIGTEVRRTTAKDDREGVEQTDHYKSLGRDKRALYQWRAKLSNQFHQCKSDAERAHVSDQIQGVQTQIEALQKHMRDVRYKKVSVVDSEEAYANDDVDAVLMELKLLTGVDLMKKLNSLRVRQSQLKRKLTLLAKNPKPDRDEIERTERHLGRIKLQIEYAKRKVRGTSRRPSV